MNIRSARIAATLLVFAVLSIGTKAQQTVPSERLADYCLQHPGDSIVVNGTVSTFRYTCPLPELKPAPIRAPASAQQTMAPADVAYCQLHTTDSFCLRGGAPAPPVKPVATPTPLPYVESTQSDCKTVSFAFATGYGVAPYYPGWIASWVSKNAKKYPGVCFTQNGGRNAYVIVVAESRNAVAGLQVTRYTNTTPVSGSGTVTDNYGEQWRYTYYGTVTETGSVDVPYIRESNTLYATAYNSRGSIVAEGSHVYSSQTGGDAYNSLGYNLGSALMAINARGRMLASVVKTISK